MFHLLGGLTAAQTEVYENCSFIGNNLPSGVASLSCKGSKCKAVCEPGKIAMGKKAVKCKQKNGKYKWKGSLPECVGCAAPTTTDSNIDFACRVTNKGVHLCNTKCKNGANVTGEGYGEFSKVKLECSCPKQGSEKKKKVYS